MASTVVRGITSAFMLGGGPTPRFQAPEIASMNDAKGTPIKFSGGYLETISADENFGTNEGVIVGVSDEAGHNSSSSGDNDLFYTPALPNVVFEITLEDETNNDHVSVATNLGLVYALQKDTTNDRWYLDENDKTTLGTGAMRMIGFSDAVGTTKARVYAVFLSEATIWSASLT